LDVAANDLLGCRELDLGGLNLASFVLASLATTCDPLGHNPHVDHRLPSLPFWLQLLATF
jgi:hypothetical protein